MTREEFFKQDRQKNKYQAQIFSEEVSVPVTIPEFEELLSQAAAVHELVVDDKLRSILAGYIHHIPNDQCTLTIEKVSKVLLKSVSNDITWIIDQEVKLKAKKELEEKMNIEKNKVVSLDDARKGQEL